MYFLFTNLIEKFYFYSIFLDALSSFSSSLSIFQRIPPQVQYKRGVASDARNKNRALVLKIIFHKLVQINFNP